MGERAPDRRPHRDRPPPVGCEAQALRHLVPGQKRAHEPGADWSGGPAPCSIRVSASAWSPLSTAFPSGPKQPVARGPATVREKAAGHMGRVRFGIATVLIGDRDADQALSDGPFRGSRVEAVTQQHVQKLDIVFPEAGVRDGVSISRTSACPRGTARRVRPTTSMRTRFVPGRGQGASGAGGVAATASATTGTRPASGGRPSRPTARRAARTI